jgi:hypothetical protein
MLYETFNLIKNFLINIDYYSFFNNATVAAIIAVLIGAFIAIRQYKKQKKIDFIEQQKYRIIDLLILLKTNIEEVDFILRRMLNTYNFVGNEQESLKKFLELLEKHEIPKLSNLINEKIPLIDKKIVVYLNAFFRDRDNIKKLHEDYKNKLKNWHGLIVSNYMDWINSIVQKKEIPLGLNISEVNESIDKLIEEIKNF